MKTPYIALLAALVVLTQAKPWYYYAQDDGYFDNEGYYHRSQNEVAKAAADYSSYKHRIATSQNEAGQSLCTSATYGEGRFEHYLHICKKGEGYCFFTDGPCCTISPDSSGPSPIASFDLTIDSFSAVVNYYSARKDENCYELDTPQPGNLDYCTGCDPPTCTDPICQDNTVLESCDSEGTCTCKTGFAPGDCCECDFQNRNNEGFFYKDPAGNCQKICQSFCTSGSISLSGCAECQSGYKAPDCCDCDDGYYLNERDKTCRSPCKDKIVSCTKGVCQCKPRYKTPDCCKCEDDYYESGTGCKSPCEGAESCTNGECNCKRGYQGPGCCECQPGFYKDNRDEKCKDPCKTGVHRCINGQCECEAGYTGDDCCECDKDYYENPDGTCQEPCEGNYISCEGGRCNCKQGYRGDDCCQSPPSCDSNQDIYIAIDTTNSFSKSDFCEINYGTELLLTSLNPSNTLNGIRACAVLYPFTKYGEDRNPGPAHELFPMETGCEEGVGKIATLIDGFMNTDRADDNPPYLDYQKGKETCPGPTLSFIVNAINRGIENGELESRKRTVIIITDGDNSDGCPPDSELTALYNLPTVTVLAAGYSKSFSGARLKKFKKDLTNMATKPGVSHDKNNPNVIIDADPINLMRRLVTRLNELGTGCSGDNVFGTNLVGNVNQYCRCVQSRSTGAEGYCKTSGCSNPDQCRSPPKCKGQKNEYNPWYIGSQNYKGINDQSLASRLSDIQYQPEHEREMLEMEILAAVEEVLDHKKNG